jgi:hypothetical protein
MRKSVACCFSKSFLAAADNLGLVSTVGTIQDINHELALREVKTTTGCMLNCRKDYVIHIEQHVCSLGTTVVDKQRSVCLGLHKTKRQNICKCVV